MVEDIQPGNREGAERCLDDLAEWYSSVWVSIRVYQKVLKIYRQIENNTRVVLVGGYGPRLIQAQSRSREYVQTNATITEVVNAPTPSNC